MRTIVIIKDWIKGFYGKYDVVIEIVVKFVIAFVALKLMDTKLGFWDLFENPFVIVLISLFCSILPLGLETTVLALCLLACVYKASLEIALLLGAFLLIIALLYYSFHPGDPIMIVLTPVLFALDMPYVLPLIAGLTGSFVSVIPMACGIIIYYLLGYIKTTPEVIALDDMSLTELPAKFKTIIEGIIDNKEMWVMIAILVVALILVYLIHLLPFAYSWYVAIFVGAVIMAVMGIMIDVPVSMIGVVIALLVSAVFVFFRYDVDFQKTDRLQFEDDDYYYYVTAIPKLSVKQFGGKDGKGNKKKEEDDY